MKVRCMFGCGLDHRRRGLGANPYRRGPGNPRRGPLHPLPPHWHKTSVLLPIARLASCGSCGISLLLASKQGTSDTATCALLALFRPGFLCGISVEMTRKRTTTRPAASNAPITSKGASNPLSSTTAQHLLEDTADDVQTAEECQAAKSPNQTQKLQPSATLQKVASQEEATSDWQRSRDAKLAARQAKSKLVKLVRSTGDALIKSKGLTPEAEEENRSWARYMKDKGILDSELSVNDPADEKKTYSHKKVFQYIRQKLRKGLAVSKKKIERGHEARAKKHTPSGNRWYQHPSFDGDPVREYNFKCAHIASEQWDNDGKLIDKGAGPLQITFKSEYDARNVVIRDRMMEKWEIQCKSEFPDVVSTVMQDRTGMVRIQTHY